MAGQGVVRPHLLAAGAVHEVGREVRAAGDQKHRQEVAVHQAAVEPKGQAAQGGPHATHAAYST
eukprot:scaffold275559_cov29-Prasinocladus_malaysianus.AAC.1